jgi:hypothetical protein
MMVLLKKGCPDIERYLAGMCILCTGTVDQLALRATITIGQLPP